MLFATLWQKQAHSAGFALVFVFLNILRDMHFFKFFVLLDKRIFQPNQTQTIENVENAVKEKNILITADSIYIDETKEEGEYKNIKYDGMYDKNIVEYTIKFRYDNNSKLLSYQYIENN